MVIIQSSCNLCPRHLKQYIREVLLHGQTVCGAVKVLDTLKKDGTLGYFSGTIRCVASAAIPKVGFIIDYYNLITKLCIINDPPSSETMILRRARPRSSVEQDHDPPSSEATILRRARPRCYILLRLSGIQAFFALAASRTAQAITSRCRTWSSSRFFFRGCLFARSHSIWLLVARHTSTSRHPFLPLNTCPQTLHLSLFSGFLGR